MLGTTVAAIIGLLTSLILRMLTALSPVLHLSWWIFISFCGKFNSKPYDFCVKLYAIASCAANDTKPCDFTGFVLSACGEGGTWIARTVRHTCCTIGNHCLRRGDYVFAAVRVSVCKMSDKVINGCGWNFWRVTGMWPRSWRLGLQAVSRRSSASTRSRLGVGTPQPRLGLELWRPWSRSRLGLD